MRESIFLSIIAGLLLFSCDNNEESPSVVEVNISFDHMVDNELVVMDQLIYKNALDQEFSIKTIKYFISEIKFYQEDGNIIEFEDIHYVDARTPESLNMVLAKKIPKGNYSGISFIHGLSPSENISGRFTDPPESLMEWPMMMGGGYHYMKLEGEYKTASTQNFFNFHSGALNGTPYEVYVDLKGTPFSVNSDILPISLAMEIQNWFQNPVNWDFDYFGPAIMGNAAAQQTVQENGSNVYSYRIIEVKE